MTSIPTFYTVGETAELLRVSDRTIRHWIARGHLHAVRMGDRGIWRVPGDEIKRLQRGW
ncbi:helix-turn-helix domain-containing protein [Inquilinus sp. CAU 1745]|uniref:helix-turn-helix domain-containing protein n=1 Tax=Inquilinus sp. CAU 1745 TaxID=3140369 RepID=UPI00325C1D68